jgi:DNA-binding SARP family transcriptional activator
MSGGLVRDLGRDQDTVVTAAPPGREGEVAAVAGMLAAAADGAGAALVLRGEPGAGQADVVRAALTRLPPGVTVVRLSGLPGEEADEGAAAVRLGAHFGLDPAHVDGPSFVTAFGRAAPTALVIDHAELLDDVSRRVLTFCANRLTGTRVCLLAVVHSIHAHQELPGVETRQLPPLTTCDVDRLVLRRVGARAPAHVIDALLAATAGNAAAVESVIADASDAQLLGIRLLEDPPAVGGPLAESASEVIASLPPQTRYAAAAIAVGADTPFALGLVLGPDVQQAGVVAPAETAGVLELRGGGYRFTHPVTRSVAAHAVHPGERRVIHGLIAAVPGLSREATGRHLAHATVLPDETIAGRLERLAQQASLDGRPFHAAAWQAEAHRLSRPGARAERRARMLAVTEGAARAALPGLDPTAVIERVATPGAVIELFGGLRIRVGDVSVPIPQGMAAQALKAVALHGSVQADVLAELLWPGAEPGLGRARLRNVLNRVRSAVGALVVRDGDEIRLAGGVRVDALEFQELSNKALVAAVSGDSAAHEMLERAIAAYTGELLPADRYVDWTTSARERLARRWLHLLDLLVDVLEAEHVEAAVEKLLQVIELDPLEESRYVRGAELLLGLGRGSAALGLLRRGQAALADVGLPPSERAIELMHELESAPVAHIGPQRRSQESIP